MYTRMRTPPSDAITVTNDETVTKFNGEKTWTPRVGAMPTVGPIPSRVVVKIDNENQIVQVHSRTWMLATVTTRTPCFPRSDIRRA